MTFDLNISMAIQLDPIWVILQSRSYGPKFRVTRENIHFSAKGESGTEKTVTAHYELI